MRRALSVGCLALASACLIHAGELQGVVTDWSCTKAMVRNGREKTLRQNRSCSMMKDWNRAAYGLITDEKKYYRLDDPGNQRIRELLSNSPDKDNLKVVVTGDIQGDTIKVANISLL